MIEDLAFLKSERKAGNEELRANGSAIGATLLDFWQWSCSDLVSNSLRGILAEYIVARALGVSQGVRVEWDAVDLKTESGIAVEVKSSAYVQSWTQARPSRITFKIKKTKGWNAKTGLYEIESRRQASVYVFCLLAHMEQSTLDPLNLDQWEFYVLPARLLNEKRPNQKTISLSSLLKLNPAQASFNSLASTIKALVPAKADAFGRPAE